MTPVERLQAAIEKLGAHKAELGEVALSSDGWLIALSDTDFDDEGDLFVYGINVMQPGQVDYDENIARALAGVCATIDAQLAILRDVLEAANIERHWDTLVYTLNALALADAILGGDS